MAWDHFEYLSASDGTTSRGPPAPVPPRVHWPSFPTSGFRKDGRWRSGRFVCTRSEKCSGCGWTVKGCARSSGCRGLDRKTVRRYVTAAERLGLDRDGGADQLGDEFVGMVMAAVRPHRSDGHVEAWRHRRCRPLDISPHGHAEVRPGCCVRLPPVNGSPAQRSRPRRPSGRRTSQSTG